MLKLSNMQIGIILLIIFNINIDPLKTAGVMENVLSLYPSQSWDTSILPVLSSYGEPFMDVVCRDSCDGHDVGRVSMLFCKPQKIPPSPTPEVFTTALISLYSFVFMQTRKREKKELS